MEVGNDLCLGIIAGGLSKYIEYPGDVVKVRLQTSTQPTTALQCFHQVLSEGGLERLYRGVSAPVVASAIETGCLFASYGAAQALWQKFSGHNPDDGDEVARGRLNIAPRLVCAAAAGALTSFCLTPFELIKCRMQTSHSTLTTKSTGYTSLITSILRQHGLRGLWTGQLGTLVRETGGTAAWFGTYELAREVLKDFDSVTTTTNEKYTSTRPHRYQEKGKEANLLHTILSGTLAGVAYNSICYPADTIKARMQTTTTFLSSSTSTPTPKFSTTTTTTTTTTTKTKITATQAATFMSTARTMIREHGIRGLYRGWGTTMCCVAPGSGAIFVVYEGLRGLQRGRGFV